MGLLHNLGQLAGHVLNAAPGYSTLGSNITNPNVNYLGALNPPTPENNYYSPTPAPASSTSTNNPQVLGAETIYGGGGSGTALTAEQLAANAQAADLANYNLGLLPQQLQSALGNIQNQYNTNNNQLDSGRAQAQQGYDTSTQQNGQQFVTNKNQIANQASTGIHSLLSLLASHGAGGSSAALYAAPDAVNKVAAEQRSGAGQTFGQNQQALDSNWGNYQIGFDNSKKELADWLGRSRQSAQSDSETSRQSILAQLAGLQSNATAAQPYIDQIKASAAHVAELGNFNPTYNGQTPVYNAPDVASYTVNQTGAPVLGTQGNNTAASPAFQYLLNLKDKQLPTAF